MLGPSSGLSLLQLGQILAMLLVLLTAQRGEFVHLLDIRNIYRELHKDLAKLRMGDFS